MLAAVWCAGVGACAGRTGLAESDVLAQPSAAPFRKVLVVAMDRRHDLREQIEGDVVKQLRGRHVAAVPSTSYLEFVAAPPARDEIRSLVSREGFDGILVAHLAQRGTEYRHVAAAGPFYGPGAGFYDYYWRAWPLVYAPTYLQAVPVVALEVRLYDAREGGRLVYTATSDEFELGDAGRALEAVSEAVSEALTRSRLVARSRLRRPPAPGGLAARSRREGAAARRAR